MKPTEGNYFIKVLKALIVLIQKTARLMRCSELKCKHNGHETCKYSLTSNMLM